MNYSKLSFALYFTEDKIQFHNLFKRFDDVTLSENASFQNKKSLTHSIILLNSRFSTSLLDPLKTRVDRAGNYKRIYIDSDLRRDPRRWIRELFWFLVHQWARVYCLIGPFGL